MPTLDDIQPSSFSPGERVGSWTLVERVIERHQGVRRRQLRIYWICRCDCGATGKPQEWQLKNNAGGCLKCRWDRGDHPAKTHGLSGTPEHKIWRAMIDRCENKLNAGYKNYGGRGIRVCSRWRRSFAAFYADMGPRPKGLTLDRRDNDRGYSPDNCRWATWFQQASNRRAPVRRKQSK